VIHDLELARAQGQRWRADARTYLQGLGEAINTQFNLWNLTEAEREVALLLLKGLSHKDIATVRAASERTVREQSRSIYAKAGLTGRTALSAFFLEDLLAPIEGVQ
jgi:DNA-binding NarL/FixJ family response regulator